jgi:hypothetical protein
LAGVFPGEEAVFDAADGFEIEQAALWATRHDFEATGLQPTVAESVISRLPAQQPIDIGLAENAGVGEKFRHEVCVGFGVSNSVRLAQPEVGFEGASNDEARRSLFPVGGLSEGSEESWFKPDRDGSGATSRWFHG